jgi:acetolactate synthase-1/2/3 large subunit
VDVDPGEFNHNRYIDAPINASPGEAACALADALQKKHFRAPDAEWVARNVIERQKAFEPLGNETEGMVHPLRMARELAPRMPDNAIFMADGANCLNWYKAILRVKQSPGWLDHSPFGAMGVSLPMALGAVAASQDIAKETGQPERPVFLGAGDGAIGFYLAEFSTASRHNLPFFTMISNDGGWGANRNSQRRNLGRNFGVDFNQNHYELVARGLDCHGEIAENPSEVGPAFDRALAAVAAGKPAVVNVVVHPESGTIRGEDPRLQMVSFNKDWPRTRITY